MSVDLGEIHPAVVGDEHEAWNHGKVRAHIEYKAEAEGISVMPQDERYTSQTCPNCQKRHKPQGRNFKCPSCGFQSHRDVAQRAPRQVNILSAYQFGGPGRIPAPPVVKHRMPHNMRLMRRCRGSSAAGL